MIKRTIVNFYKKNKFFKKGTDFVLNLKSYISLCGRIKKNNGVFLVLTPYHGNMGDHAIAYAESKLLSENNIKYEEITEKELRVLKYFNSLNKMNGSTIIINGGGNLGILWPDVEKLIQDVITANKLSKIVIMPSTIYYDSSEASKAIMNDSVKTFNLHTDLTVFARERISYNEMKKMYNNVFLSPDIVMSLNESDRRLPRKGCLMCLRSDHESTISKSEADKIYDTVSMVFENNIKKTDTVLNHSLKVSKREETLQKKFDEFRQAEIVVTDRLHGMIFSAVTGTPCVVLNSASPKVKGCYEWLKKCGYIFMTDSVECFCKSFADNAKMCVGRNFAYDLANIKNEFDQLYKCIKEISVKC